MGSPEQLQPSGRPHRARRLAGACAAGIALLALGSSLAGRIDPWTACTIVGTAAFAWAAAELFAALMRISRREAAALPVEAPRVWRHDGWIAAALYVVATLAFFHPILPHLDTALLGPPSDQPCYLWTLWWGHDVLLGHREGTLHYTDLIFFPEGTRLEYHVYSWYNLFLAIPLRSLLSLPATYNLLQLQTFVLSGLGAFALCRHLTRDSAASLLAGFVYAFSPSHQAFSLAHLNTASIQFLPFLILFFVRSVKARRRSDVALAALFFLLNAACSWYHMVYALFFLLFAYVYLAWSRGRLVLPDVLARIAIIVVAGTLPLAPWIVAMLLAGPRDVAGVWAITGYDHYVADLLALWVPHAAHWSGAWGPIRQVNALYPLSDLYPHASTAYLGLSGLALAGIALARAPAATARFACGALAFLLLALGAHLHFAGWMLPVALPTRLLQEIPFLDSVRSPIRAMLLVYLFLGLLVGVGLARIRDGMAAGWKRRAVVALAAASVLLDYASVARARTEVTAPPVYAAIPRTGERFGILDVPLTVTNAALYMGYQTQHGFPLVEGYESNSGEAGLMDRLATLGGDADLGALLAEHGVRYVVVHHDPPEQAQRAPHWIRGLESMGFRTLFADSRATLFQVY